MSSEDDFEDGEKSSQRSDYLMTNFFWPHRFKLGSSKEEG